MKIKDKGANYAFSARNETPQNKCNLSAKDALHLACASFSKADYLLTCDDNFIKKAMKLQLEIKVLNPLDYIREVKT